MTLLAFVGFPVSETFYGYILMGQIKAAALLHPESGAFYLGIGIASGLAICLVAVGQGWIGAAAADAFSDTNKGFGNYFAVLGVCETIALFAMVLSMTSL
jgi:V/A-type H+-transporting ATPase subunit K